jgi:hypothetical protein
MVWEILKGDTSPPKNVCIVVLTQGGLDFEVKCEVSREDFALFNRHE